MLMSINEPIPVEVESGSNYFWCSCGKSKKQPFCDGSHVGTDYSPLKFISEKSEVIYFCGCKSTANAPFCDGSHNKTTLKAEESKTFSAHIEPDNLKIDIEEEESILIASLRNNINHLSACGGTGKCSTCRIEVTMAWKIVIHVMTLKPCLLKNYLSQKTLDLVAKLK